MSGEGSEQRPAEERRAQRSPGDLRALARAAREEVAGSGGPAARGIEAHGAGTLGEAAGDTVGSYELVRPLGEGGMGTVWEARRTEGLERRVALKLIKAGMDTRRVVARFEEERRVLARMAHPHIAAVFDGGAAPSGRPFFVMELVDGPPISVYAEARSLDLDGRIALAVQVAQALEHAHQKGVVHRDIKPSNVLVTEVDGAPSVKVIDFGIARVTGEEEPLATRLTADAEVLGTLACMAPEQARGDADVDTRADVYGLGALLYELLTGVAPFDFEAGARPSLEDALRIVREEDPERPSARMANGQGSGGFGGRRDVERVRDELDWIVLRALDKDRERRYPTVAALGEDLARFRRGDAIEARPPSRSYLVRKFVRRNRGAVVSLAAIAVALVAGVLGTGYGLWKSVRSAEAARQSAARMEAANDFLSSILTGAIPRYARGKDPELMIAVLEDATERLEAGEIRDPSVASAVHMDVAEAWIGLGRIRDGEGHLASADALLEDVLSADAPARLRIARRRADALRLLERPAEAIALYRRTIERAEAVLGPEHPEALSASRGLASALHRAGEVDEAHRILVRVVEVERRTLNGPERARSSALAELGTLEFFARQDPAAAREHLSESLALLREHEGPDHPWALRNLETLSQIEAATGNVEGSLGMCEEISAQYERVYGPEHRETLAAKGNHAFTLAFAGRFDASDALMGEVLAAQLRTLGPDAPDTLWTRMQLAIALDRKGQCAEAAEELEDIVEKTEARGVPAFDERSALAQALAGAGAQDRALAVAQETLERAKGLLGDGHPLTATLTQQLAVLQGTAEPADEGGAGG